jgi:hypothetical protein
VTDQYCTGDQIEKNEIDGHVACKGEMRGVYRCLVGKPEGKRPLGRSRRKWEDNIKIYLQEVEWGRGVWSESSWLRVGTGGGHL